MDYYIYRKVYYTSDYYSPRRPSVRYSDIPPVRDSDKIEVLYKILCATRKRGDPPSCGHCKWSLDSDWLLNGITFEFLIGMMITLLKYVQNTNLYPVLQNCKCDCKGRLYIETAALDPVIKDRTDAVMCKVMMKAWSKRNTLHRDEKWKISNLNEILDNTKTSNGVISVLDHLYNNYPKWKSPY